MICAAAFLAVGAELLDIFDVFTVFVLLMAPAFGAPAAEAIVEFRIPKLTNALTTKSANVLRTLLCCIAIPPVCSSSKSLRGSK